MFYVALILTALMILVDILAHGDALITPREGILILIVILYGINLDYLFAVVFGLRKRFGWLFFVLAPVTIPSFFVERIWHEKQ